MARHRTAEEMRVRQMIPIEAAYAAGIIDGEGTITLTVASPTANRPKRYTPRLQVANTDLGLLGRVNGMIGGGRLDSKNNRPPQKVCYALTWTPMQIRAALPQLLPYLYLKKRQAEGVLRYLELVDAGARGAADGDVAEMEAIYQEVKRLNHRGFQRQAEGEPLWEPQGPVAERPLYRANCEHCGIAMTALMPHKRFCSDQCQTAHYYETVLHPAQQAALWHTETCMGCGKQFETDYASRHYCSRPCYLRHRRAMQARGRVVEKVCPACGTKFESGNSKRTYCRPACVVRAATRRKAAAAPKEEAAN